MVQQNYSMSREARTIISHLDDLASQHNITQLVTPSEIMMADLLCLKYYTAPIISMINQKIKKMKKVGSKHFVPSYWLNVIDGIWYNNSSVKREYQIGLYGSIDSFGYISSYIPTDYSIKDAYEIYCMITTHTPMAVLNAIHIAKANNVYNIYYVKAVIEKEQAVANIRKQEIQSIIDKEKESDRILSKEKVHNTEDDIEMMKQNWSNTKANAELESMFNKLYGE